MNRQRGIDYVNEVVVYDASDYIRSQENEIHNLREENMSLREGNGGGFVYSLIAMAGISYITGTGIKCLYALSIKEQVIDLLSILAGEKLDEKGLKKEVVEKHYEDFQSLIQELNQLEEEIQNTGSIRFFVGFFLSNKIKSLRKREDDFGKRIEEFIASLRKESSK